MKSILPKNAIQSLLDVERNRAFYIAISKTITPGCTVLDCGAGLGGLSIMAAKEGAQSILSIERNKQLIKLIDENLKSSGVSERAKSFKGEAISFNGKADVIIWQIANTLLIEDDTAKTINAFLSKNVLSPTTSIIPFKYSLFFELVNYDFEFYDSYMPMPVQSRNHDADSRCNEFLTNSVLLSEVFLTKRIYPKVHYEGMHIARNKGYINAIKFSMVSHLTDEVLIGSTNTLNSNIYFPINSVYVSSGDFLKITIDYTMGSGFDTLKVNLI